MLKKFLLISAFLLAIPSYSYTIDWKAYNTPETRHYAKWMAISLGGMALTYWVFYTYVEPRLKAYRDKQPPPKIEDTLKALSLACECEKKIDTSLSKPLSSPDYSLSKPLPSPGRCYDCGKIKNTQAENSLVVESPILLLAHKLKRIRQHIL